GIGDKHVPWVHNVKNTDLVVAIDDNAVVNLARLFNEPVGRAYLVKQGVPEELVSQLDLMGFSSISNTLSAIKMAKYYELGENDIVLSVLTDSMELYGSRLREMHEEFGEYTEINAAAHYARYLQGVTTDNLTELTYVDRRRIHNLKYYTWVEQQGKTYEEIQSQWYDESYFTGIQNQVQEIDALIDEFNSEVGLIK
ncbi:MAG: pyridoxal-5-phosphate-dependent protein subunit beta, partial [Anaerolineales bacterium]|nr:pyridoxal-5-phosphate-dependent protein subunit beta [Anaerolineales bacterium]